MPKPPKPPFAPPTETQLQTLLGPAAGAWQQVAALVDSLYEMDRLWGPGGKGGTYEYKYRRGGKTLCALYARPGSFGFMVVLGRAEQEKVEAQAANFTEETLAQYHATHIYHDGRWLMLDITTAPPMADIQRLLAIKRRPNRTPPG